MCEIRPPMRQWANRRAMRALVWGHAGVADAAARSNEPNGPVWTCVWQKRIPKMNSGHRETFALPSWRANPGSWEFPYFSFLVFLYFCGWVSFLTLGADINHGINFGRPKRMIINKSAHCAVPDDKFRSNPMDESKVIPANT